MKISRSILVQTIVCFVIAFLSVNNIHAQKAVTENRKNKQDTHSSITKHKQKKAIKQAKSKIRNNLKTKKAKNNTKLNALPMTGIN